MVIEQMLMENIRQTGRNARRLAHSNGQPRGFGHILELLSHDGISQQQIADTLQIRPQSVSEAVASLHSRGYIRREPSPSDKRMTLIYITDAGIRRREELREERKAHAMQIFSALTESEKQELLRLLEKTNGAFEKEVP